MLPVGSFGLSPYAPGPSRIKAGNFRTWEMRAAMSRLLYNPR